jgi:hypothetical protein
VQSFFGALRVAGDSVELSRVRPRSPSISWRIAETWLVSATSNLETGSRPERGRCTPDLRSIRQRGWRRRRAPGARNARSRSHHPPLGVGPGGDRV